MVSLFGLERAMAVCNLHTTRSAVWPTWWRLQASGGHDQAVEVCPACLATCCGYRQQPKLQWVPVLRIHDWPTCSVEGDEPDLVEVGGSQLPSLGGKVDVVAVMHLGQVIEAAGLHADTYMLASIQYRQPQCKASCRGCLGW